MSEPVTRRPPRSPNDPPSGRDRGAVAVEMALLAPLVLMMIGLFAFGYRLWAARAAVESAAGAAARAASLASSPWSGEIVARDVARANLATLGVDCRSAQVSPDTGVLSQPAGQAGIVRVTVSCVVSMRDLVLPGAPGTITVTRSASEPIDTFRARQS